MFYSAFWEQEKNEKDGFTEKISGVISHILDSGNKLRQVLCQ